MSEITLLKPELRENAETPVELTSIVENAPIKYCKMNKRGMSSCGGADTLVKAASVVVVAPVGRALMWGGEAS